MSPSPTATAPVRPIDLRPARTGRWVRTSDSHLRTAPEPDLDATSFEVRGLPGSFCMYYLPELDLRSGSIVACEALLRWQHPDFGLLRPGITLEGTRWHRQLPEIEQQALAQVCRQIESWRRDPVGQVALNVSPAHLLGPFFLPSLDRALAASDIDPAQLAIDVPIEVVATDPGLARHVTGELVERGVGVVIDGVGGIPSHHRLRRIPASGWKVDLRVGSGRDRAIHPSVADALAEAHDAGMIATAKAVEDLDLLRAVRDLGFDRAFGYAISPAVDPCAMRDVAERGAVRARPLFGPPATLPTARR
jgi:EAL domain-containing protein (putative c-di-GMP-specific phosphodiesterase class I)